MGKPQRWYINEWSPFSVLTWLNVDEVVDLPKIVSTTPYPNHFELFLSLGKIRLTG